MRSYPGRRIRILFVLWFALFSLLDFSSLAGLVLCVGEDGHLALESSPDGDCCEPAGMEAGFIHGAEGDAEDHCGDCRDIRVAAPPENPSLVSRVLKVSAPLAALAILPAESAFGAASESSIAFARSPAPADFSAPSLRSTVLRI